MITVERVATVNAHEGPVYLPGPDALCFTTVPIGIGADRRAQIKRLDLGDGRISVVDADVIMPNGMTLDYDGSLIVCDQGGLEHRAQLSRVDPATGGTATLVDSWMGRALNSPNDVRVRSDGTIWFTDPSYGYLQGFRPPPEVGDHVYRFDPVTGELTSVDNTFDKPNGLSFSPDESLLYVGDSGQPNEVRALPVLPSGLVAYGDVVAVTYPSSPDGITVDVGERLYISATDGVRIFSPAGVQLDLIPVPGAVNFTFGGPGRDHLYITADDSIWVATLDTKGA